MTNPVSFDNVMCLGFFGKPMCICTPKLFKFLRLLFQVRSGLLLQGQRCGFEVGKDSGPTLFTKSFERGALG